MDYFDRFKMGAIMGATVGGSMGFLLGTFNVIRYGHGGDGFVRVVGRSVAQMGGMFGLMMGVGAVIRSDEGGATSKQQSRQLLVSSTSLQSVPLAQRSKAP